MRTLLRRAGLGDWPLARVQTLLRFALVGLASSATYGIVIMVATSWGGIEARLSSVLAYVAGMLVNFPLQRNFTFQSGGGIKSEILKYFGVHMVSLLISVAIVHIVVQILHWSVIASVAFVVVIIPLIQFLALEAWVFSSKRIR